MRQIAKQTAGRFCLLAGLLFMPVISHAQLMNVPLGTLKFLDDGVYAELSIPASAFEQADINNDKRLSATELAANKADMVSLLTQQITLSDDEKTYFLTDVLIVPVAPLNSPISPATRVVVQGKFTPDGSNQELRFNVGVFESSADEQALTLPSTSNSRDNVRQIFK